MNAPEIENVKLPIGKKRQRDNERRRRIFKAYADVYEKLYISRPVKFEITSEGFMRISTHSAICDCASEARIKKITAMMRDRIKG